MHGLLGYIVICIIQWLDDAIEMWKQRYEMYGVLQVRLVSRSNFNNKTVLKLYLSEIYEGVFL